MASLTKEEFIDLINSLLADNSSQQISPEDLRNSFLTLVDSIHNLLVDKDISALNAGSRDIRTTRLGIDALDKIDLPGRSSEDNTAIGYYSLGGNYDGAYNTGLGSYSLGCNLYGDNNIGVGYNSLPANVDGSGNVAIGNHALYSNKHGDFNIAIGHGAGYWVGDNTNYRLYVGSHEMDADALCGLTDASGSIPLMYGDLKNLKLGINTNILHNYGILQVSGNITPVVNMSGDLGNVYYSWNGLYLNSGINYAHNANFKIGYINSGTLVQSPVMFLSSGGKIGLGTNAPSGDYGLVTSAGNIVPSQSHVYSLGTPELMWDGVFNDLIVSGNAIINDLQYNTINECFYDCKTLHLATSGICDGDIFNSTICGYLNDEALQGAGLEVHSSGSNYRRDYRFIYTFPDQTLGCLEADNNYSRSHWQSNISFHLMDGLHLQTQRVLSKNNLSLVSESGCFGMFLRPNEPNRFYVASEDDIVHPYQGDVNFIYPSGFTTLYGALNSGVIVSNQLLTRINNSGLTAGYSLNYHNEHNPNNNRFALTSVKSSDKSQHYDAFVLMASGEGFAGFSNVQSSGFKPLTTLNVLSSGSCNARFASNVFAKSSIELVANGNAQVSGLQIAYIPVSGMVYSFDDSNSHRSVAKFSIITSSGVQGIVSFTEGGYVGLGKTHIGDTTTFTPNAPLTIYHTGASSGTISLKEQASSPTASSDFGKIYVKPVVGIAGQSQSAYLLDDAGNEIVLSRNPSNTTDGLIYSDANRNTYGGEYSPVSRPTASAYSNTTYGYTALSGVTSGSRNTIVGKAAGKSVTTGSDNVFVGHDIGASITTGSRNVMVGSDINPSGFNGSNNIVIGYNNLTSANNDVSNSIIIGSGHGLVPNNMFLLGYGTTPLLSGVLSGTKSLTLKQAKLGLDGIYNEQSFYIDNTKEGSRYVTTFQVKDAVNTATNNGYLSLRFLDSLNSSRTLMDFDYVASPMATTPTFQAPGTARPFVGVSGDIKLLGAIRFANGTSIEDGNLDVELNFIDLPNALDTPDTITTTNSHIALSVPSGGDYYVGKMTLQALASYVGSGFAAVSENCNHIFSNVENSIDPTKNSSSVFIGCGVGAAATGWKHSVFIGSDVGIGATTPNSGLATDTASIFIGYKTGREADNIENSIFIGTNAGAFAENASDSIYVGSNAGLYSSCNNSIGIGENSLRGTTSVIETGARNIEIVAGMLNNTRLMYSSGNLSDRLNIQNTIAGNTSQRRLSIGHATLDPTAVLTVRKNDIITGHASTDYIQDWWCNGTRVAAIDCDGTFVVNPSGDAIPSVIEGEMPSGLAPAASYGSPTSGIIILKNDAWTTIGNTYIVNRDNTLTIPSGAFVVANRVNGTYRPVWVSC